jgi:hypothetical protein
MQRAPGIFGPGAAAPLAPPWAGPEHILLFTNIDVFRHILIIDISVLAKSNTSSNL